MSPAPAPPAGRPRRVLMTADAVGGVLHHAVTLTRALSARGHRVRLAVLGSPSDGALADLPEEASVATAAYRLEWMKDGLDHLEAAAGWIRDQAEQHGADLVHLNQLAYAPWIEHPTLVVAHSDVLSWHAELRGRPAASGWEGYARAVRRGLQAADAVAAPSSYQARLLERHYGRTVDHVVWNGVDGEAPEVYAPADAGSARGVCAREGDALRVAVVGRLWDPAKGVGVLDEAVGRLPGGVVRVGAAGDVEGPWGERIELAHARALGRLAPADVHRLLSAVDVYAAPSLYEPFGLAPLEAALHGCALVLSDIGSFRELWGDAAVFFAPGDAAALAEALAGLQAEPARRGDLALRARRRALERFGVDRMAHGYEEVYAGTRLRSSLEDACV